ncbi:flavodoxin domain-containing protein [Bacillus pacificus]
MVGRIKPDELKGVQYAVFGCGDHNWASTYQRIPRYIDEQMAQKEQQDFLNAEKQMQSGDFEEQLEQWRKYVV